MRPEPAAWSRGRIEALLNALLAAHRDGSLDDLLRRHPRLARRFGERLLAPVRTVAGDALPDDPADGLAWRAWLRGSLARLRPDGGTGLALNDRVDWLERTAWRPLLALICHFGFAPVPRFPDAYRAHGGESPAEQLAGLWNIGASTYYRHLDRGRRQLALLLAEAPPVGEAALARDALLQHEVYALLGLDEPTGRIAWHARQATRALAALQPRCALWHLLLAGDTAGFVGALERFRVELANDADTDAMVQRLGNRELPWRARFDLELARAGLARVRGDDAAELRATEDALRLADAANDALRLGVAYGALGKYHEPRDADRAFACYQDSAEFLRQAGIGDAAGGEAEVVVAYVHTLVKLAWLYLLRNDPRAQAVLERAEALRARCAGAPDAVAMLDQVWGEYWRRAGDLKRALEHKHRALLVYERLGDRQSVLKTYTNLSLIYGDAKDFARAIDYSQRVLDLASRLQVEPETVASTLLNLGAAYFWQGKYDAAIDAYGRTLELAQQARLPVLAGRAHYNLAEAHYRRFQALDDAEDERLGDAHTAAALALPPDDGDAASAEQTRQLKAQILGPRDHEFADRLLPGEFAAHFEAMAAIQRQRAALALPLAAPERAAAHLAIAQAYLEISVQEREAAVALIDQHQLGARFDAELQALQQVFGRSLSREQQLAAHWREATAGLLPAGRAQALLQHLLRAGAISKSGYAQLCGTGLATASKHLGQLAERGALQQTGRGPSTRYRLPDAAG